MQDFPWGWILFVSALDVLDRLANGLLWSYIDPRMSAQYLATAFTEWPHVILACGVFWLLLDWRGLLARSD